MSPTRPLTAITALLALNLTLAAATPVVLAQDLGQREPEPGYPGPSHYLRAAYQVGTVLQTNDFLKGNNLSGEPIESFQSLRLEFGWQTDGSKDWHHSYNFPSFGLGLYGADFDNDEELGSPTSLYGFFNWQLIRGERWKFNFDLAFGFTNDWKPYDPVTNPKNTALGLGRSVHIEPGLYAEYRLARRWSLIGGVSATHFSNGGTQRPNHGLNAAGPILFMKWDTEDPVPAPTRRYDVPCDKGWDWTFTTSYGKRNLDLEIEDPDLRAQYGNRSYFIGNLTLGPAYRFSFKSRVAMGLDVCYDESVGDLILLDRINKGQPPGRGEHSDRFELAVFGGYEIYAHRTHLIVHLGYKVFTKEVPGRLPKLYQRLGVRQFVYRNSFLGMNVRFHEIGSADNLEWVLGFRL